MLRPAGLEDLPQMAPLGSNYDVTWRSIVRFPLYLFIAARSAESPR